MRSFQGIAFAFLVLFAITGCYSALSPLLIVPGILGSRLEAKLHKHYSPRWWCSTQKDWFTVWLSIRRLTPLYIDCWLNNTRMLFKNGEYFNSEGVEIRTSEFGETSSVEYLDSHGFFLPYFYRFVRFFTKRGYVRGVSIRAAPYDWRLSPDLLEKECYYDDVQLLIEAMYKDNGNTSVTIVTHSMGSPVMLYFLTHIASQQWKDKYLKAFVPLSGIWKGSVNVLISIVTGDAQGVPIVKSSKARHLQRASPSTYFLMPVPDHNTWSSRDPVIVTPDKNYTVYDYSALFTDMKYSIGYTQYKALPSLLTTLPPPNVDTYCYYGTNVSTPAVLVYKKGQFPDAFPSIVKGNGDGTVNDVSLRACSIWKQTQSHKVKILSFPGINHQEIVKDSVVLKAVLDIVRK